MKDIIKNALIITLVAIIGSGVLGWVYSFTAPEIQKQKERSLREGIKTIFSNEETFDELKDFGGKELSDGIKVLNVYKVKNKDGSEGYVFHALFPGYGGKIESLIGYEDDVCSGIIILEHAETPGLGAKITTEEFRKQFVNKSLSDPFVPKKDVVAITGATVSSRSVSTAIKRIAEFYREEVKGGR